MAEVAGVGGISREVRLDHGPKFAGRMLDAWSCLNGVTLDFSRPGKPTGNGVIATHNGHSREE
jgi:putative transposase